ncbi:hypothetical protein [Limnospira platensis]|uniref:hypothetical protein n=1 Tax=Limnospira platensis TaxID=118562 RepID=UPI003D6FD0DF
MKKLLTTIGTVSFLVVGWSVSPAAAFPPWAMPPEEPDEELIFNGEVLNDDQTDFVYDVADILGITTEDLLNDPGQMDGLHTGGKQEINRDGWGVFSKNGCSVNADCALKAIGLGLTLQCLGSGYDPEAWARCLKSRNEDAYYAALECTWQQSNPSQPCNFLAHGDTDNTYACNATNPVAALRQNSVELPTFSQSSPSERVSIDLLSQG